jgi:hypothetical protein
VQDSCIRVEDPQSARKALWAEGTTFRAPEDAEHPNLQAGKLLYAMQKSCVRIDDLQSAREALCITDNKEAMMSTPDYMQESHDVCDAGCLRTRRDPQRSDDMLWASEMTREGVCVLRERCSQLAPSRIAAICVLQEGCVRVELHRGQMIHSGNPR